MMPEEELAKLPVTVRLVGLTAMAIIGAIFGFVFSGSIEFVFYVTVFAVAYVVFYVTAIPKAGGIWSALFMISAGWFFLVMSFCFALGLRILWEMATTG